MSHFDLSSKNKQIEEYDKQTLEPDFWQDQKKAQQVIRAKNALKDIDISKGHDHYFLLKTWRNNNGNTKV